LREAIVTSEKLISGWLRLLEHWAPTAGGGAEVELVTLERRESAEAGPGGRCDADYDFVLIDCFAEHDDAQRPVCCANGVIIANTVQILHSRPDRPWGQHHQTGARQP
jgi:hypothetical protein